MLCTVTSVTHICIIIIVIVLMQPQQHLSRVCTAQPESIPYDEIECASPWLHNLETKTQAPALAQALILTV